jgi:hypothetical protein
MVRSMIPFQCRYCAEMLNVVAIGVVCLVFVCAVYDAREDTYQWSAAFVLALIASFPPALTYVLAHWSRRQTRRAWLVDLLALLLLLLGATLYVWYAVNGETNPETAAHLHFFAAPFVYSLLVILTMGSVATVLWVLRASNNTLTPRPPPPRVFTPRLPM